MDNLSASPASDLNTCHAGVLVVTWPAGVGKEVEGTIGEDALPGRQVAVEPLADKAHG